MNSEGKQKVPFRRSMIAVVIAVLAIGYQLGRPKLETWLGTPLPSLIGDSGQVESGVQPDRGSQSGSTGKSTAKTDSTARKDTGSDRQSPGQAARSWLKDIGGDRYRSPEGLIYTPGREHRIDHVLKHCVDDTTKPTHGVFSGDAVEVMKLVDEAWRIAKTGKVKPENSRGRSNYVVPMGRVVGHTGGQKAKRNGQRNLRSVKLVLAEDRIITAFPVE